LLRARRRLVELPSAVAARLEFVPVPSGLAEVRGAVNERPLFPTGALAYAGVGLSAAATREVRLTLGSAAGGGELLGLAWRFWPNRPGLGVSAHAPAPWGGLWGVEAEWEQQALDLPAGAPLEHGSVRMTVSDWATGALRWELNGGVEHRPGAGRYGLLGGSAMLATPRDRVTARAGSVAWIGDARFAVGQLAVTARSSTERRGFVGLASGTFQAITAAAPLDLWPAGDIGHARATLLRAHPVLDQGRLRVSRLGRVLVHGSAEGQRWWALRGLLRIAAAAFVDTARTGSRLEGPALADVDIGVGARLAGVGLPGIFRADLGKSVNDGNFTISLSYVP
jgi:hypothetical protein